MMPSLAASLQSTDTAETGAAPSAAVPIFTKTVQIGDGNTSTPSIKASAAAGAGDGVPQGASSYSAVGPWIPVVAVAAGMLFAIVLVRNLKP